MIKYMCKLTPLPTYQDVTIYHEIRNELYFETVRIPITNCTSYKYLFDNCSEEEIKTAVALQKQQPPKFNARFYYIKEMLAFVKSLIDGVSIEKVFEPIFLSKSNISWYLTSEIIIYAAVRCDVLDGCAAINVLFYDICLVPRFASEEQKAMFMLTI